MQQRYDILDGLRGVAAVCVIWYHFFEGFATSVADQMMNHGYLAVDFFFVLSGFVIGYAYDGRWKQRKITVRGFVIRRIVRLQPMVVLDAIFGAVAFVVQGSVRWDGSFVPLYNVLTALLLGVFMVPVIPGADADVRGNGEMFPLNGPEWSLFFEYIGSFIYAVLLRKLSIRSLIWVVALSGIAQCVCVLCNLSGAYHLGMGWTLAGFGLAGGFVRMMFSFSAGLLIARCFKPCRVRGAFWLCSAVIAAVMACPYVGGNGGVSTFNGFYDLVCTLVIFPIVVYAGACGITTDSFSKNVCEFFGQLSYPVYIIHYPVMYLFYAWAWNNGITAVQALPVCIALFIGIILLAWGVLRWYDEPVRRYLSRRWLKAW